MVFTGATEVPFAPIQLVEFRLPISCVDQQDASDRIGTRGTIQIPDEIVEKMFVRGNQVYAEA